MWGIFFVVIAVVIVIIEVPSLLKKKLKKELWVFSILLIFGLGLSIAQSLNMDLPNPIDLIAFLYKPFSEFIYGFLK